MVRVRQRAAAQPRPTTPPVVLVVEDEAEVRELLADTLALEGYRVRAVGDAHGVLALIRRLRPDLTILDLRLPGVTGIQLLPLLVSDAPEMPILIISAAPDLLREYAVEFRRLGVRVLDKPFTLEQFLAAVRQSLSSHPVQPPADSAA